MTLNDGADLFAGLCFAAGFGLGGVMMVFLLTSGLRIAGEQRAIPPLFPILVGLVAGADLAALIGRTMAGPMVLGAIAGSLAVLRAAIDK